jgi:hypothetical protein
LKLRAAPANLGSEQLDSFQMLVTGDVNWLGQKPLFSQMERGARSGPNEGESDDWHRKSHVDSDLGN